MGNTRYLIIFGTLCLLDLRTSPDCAACTCCSDASSASCITLPFRAVQNNATALCQDLSESGNCTLAYVLIGFHYTSVIFGMFGESCCSMPLAHFHLAIIGFVITYIDRRASSAPKVSPQYLNAQLANSPFTTFQYPPGVEFKNVKVFTGLPARNARQAYGERSNGNPV
jgi:hypothetical protein